MVLSALLLCLTGPSLEPATEREPVYIAVTRSGIRIEAHTGVAPGDLEFETPFGLYRTPRDPVVEVVDGGRERDRLQDLRRESESGLEHWLSDAVDGGQLSELVAGAQVLLKREPGRQDVFEALESWGVRLDAVPANTKLTKRTSWLWKQVQGKDPARATLYAAQLWTIVARSVDSDFSQQVSLADLQKGLKHRSPHVRRAAARIAGKQEVFDLIVPLLQLSIQDKAEGVRDGGAYACSILHPHDARQYWTLALARAQETQRIAAARHMGRYGGEHALDGLMVILSAHKSSKPGGYRFGTYDIQVVRGVDKSLTTRGLGGTASSIDILDQSSSFKVTLYEKEVSDAILAALDEWLGKTSGRSADEWLAWYLEDSGSQP